MNTLFDHPAAAPRTDVGGLHPFSVLRADMGKWQNRKRAWNDLGFNSRAGREQTTTWNSTGCDNVSRKLGTEISGLSTFDPVLAELSYDWYTPTNGHILDPFAGGSVRGLVAGHGGYHYTGIDLSQQQVDANRPQVHAWRERGLIDDTTTVEYIAGDAADVTPTLPDHGYDYVFTCPPYHNLEVYSDLPEDLSTMAWGDFEDAYTHIITETIRALKPHRFATWVVGEVRDYKGMVRGLAPLTIAAHEAAGAHLYNDAVLLNVLGTVPMRLGNQWRASRKMGRHHQYVLTFVKGDPKAATRAATG